MKNDFHSKEPSAAQPQPKESEYLAQKREGKTNSNLATWREQIPVFSGR